MYYKSYSSHIKPKKRRHRWFKKQRHLLPLTRGESDVGSYKNPYRATINKSGLRGKITGGLLIATLIAWAAVLTLHPYFNINKITVSGTVNIGQHEVHETIDTAINQKKIFILPQNNFFLLNEDRLQEIVRKRFPVSNVIISKSFPHNLDIKLTERLAFIIYDDGKKYTLVDEFGVPQKTLREVAIHEQKIVEHTGVEEGSAATSTTHYPDVKALQVQYGAYPIVYDQKQNGHLPSEVVQGIIQIHTFLKDNIDFATHHFIYPNEHQTLLVEDAGGLTVAFNPFENLDEQLETFKHAWQRELRKEKGSRVLINARYPGRVYIEE